MLLESISDSFSGQKHFRLRIPQLSPSLSRMSRFSSQGAPVLGQWLSGGYTIDIFGGSWTQMLLMGPECVWYRLRDGHRRRLTCCAYSES